MMQTFSFGPRQLLPLGTGLAPTSTNLTASTHWAGGNFWAARTETIDRIYFRTGTVSSPLLTLQSAITALDANGYPLGTDVAASSTTTVNPAATTSYEHTISASVTKGNLYGIILRISAYTSGSCNIVHRGGGGGGPQGMGNLFPCASVNTGSNSKQANATLMAVRYATSGIVQTMGLVAPHSTNTQSTAGSGQVVATRFVLDRPMLLSGYYASGDVDAACEFGIYAGTDNTPLTGTTCNMFDSVAASTSTPFTVPLATPYLLPAGTYRAGLKQTTATTISINQLEWYAAGHQASFPGMTAEEYSSLYTTSWADTTTRLSGVLPMFAAGPDELPNASLLIGL